MAYISVKWWQLFNPEQCSGINKFVANISIPLLSFRVIASNNPYQMSLKIILEDSLQKLSALFVLAILAKISPMGSLDWLITGFSVATLPNALIMGIPLLNAMDAGATSANQHDETPGTNSSFNFWFGLKLPEAIDKSVSTLADGGLGMAMFSLGLFMVSQSKIVACGAWMAVLSIGIRFLLGPSVMAASSYAAGLRARPLDVAIVQVRTVQS
ncbi:probable auxin efflux carrier component 8 [Aristolochia californica]|uniref:probable auxin efflux carrier component 8 n=1 Tax=Aristolochia californica TaxID=171875 RepID=UPI0035D8B26E